MGDFIKKLKSLSNIVEFTTILFLVKRQSLIIHTELFLLVPFSLLRYLDISITSFAATAFFLSRAAKRVGAFIDSTFFIRRAAS